MITASPKTKDEQMAEINPTWLDIINYINSKNLGFQQSVYRHYMAMDSAEFGAMQKCRISEETLFERINSCNWIKNKIYLLTDIDTNNSRYEILTIDDIKNHINEDCTFILAYNKDFEGIKAINELRKYNLKYNSIHIAFPVSSFYLTDENAYNTFQYLNDSGKINKNYFSVRDFENLFQAIKQLPSLKGDYVEIGTYMGDSAYAALSYMKNCGINKKAYFLDTYEGFNYDEAKKSEDSFWQITDHHSETSFDFVKQKLSEFENANVVKRNIIADEMPKEIKEIAVCNIDVDMYEATKAALYKVKDLMTRGGIIFVEDYGHTPCLIGAQAAVNEFIEENSSDFSYVYLRSAQIMLVKR